MGGFNVSLNLLLITVRNKKRSIDLNQYSNQCGLFSGFT